MSRSGSSKLKKEKYNRKGVDIHKPEQDINIIESKQNSCPEPVPLTNSTAWNKSSPVNFFGGHLAGT